MDATEITLAGGARLEVRGSPEEVGEALIAAARGSIMQFAWLEEAESGRAVAVNPEQIVTLRAAG